MTSLNLYLWPSFINIKIITSFLDKNKKEVIIFILINEGQRYRFNEVMINTRYYIEEVDDYFHILLKSLKIYDFFSLLKVTNCKKEIQRSLSTSHMRIKVKQQIVQLGDGAANIIFDFQMKKNRFIRKVEFTGNKKTPDKVLRSYLKQKENNKLSYPSIIKTKTLIMKNNYASAMKIKLKKLKRRKIYDLIFEMKEINNNKFGAGMSYLTSTGAVFHANSDMFNIFNKHNNFNFKITKGKKIFEYTMSYSQFNISNSNIDITYNMYCKNQFFSIDAPVFDHMSDILGTAISLYKKLKGNKIGFTFGYENVRVNLNEDKAPVSVKKFVTSE
jgi:outer membrane protein insertion porin family